MECNARRMLHKAGHAGRLAGCDQRTDLFDLLVLQRNDDLGSGHTAYHTTAKLRLLTQAQAITKACEAYRKFVTFKSRPVISTPDFSSSRAVWNFIGAYDALSRL